MDNYGQIQDNPRKKMDFSEKISIILKTNTLAIRTKEDLAEHCGFNRDTIRKAIIRGGELSERNSRTLQDKLRVNPEWWETGNGEIYLTPVPEPAINEKEKDPYELIRILTRNIDRMGELNEYLLKKVKDLGG
jgi:hypothetical protein